MPRREFQERYSTEFMTALAAIATPRRHANVLQHMLGYFKETLDRESRAELLAIIEDHASGHVPLVVPLTLFAHHIRRCDVPFLAEQVYLRPHPVELMLRTTCDAMRERVVVNDRMQRGYATGVPSRSDGTSRRGSRRI